MEFETPNETGFTIYSKSGCPNCTNVKKMLQENKISYTIVHCDDYLIEERDNFLVFIQNLSEKEIKVFPIVFFDGKIVGGFKETKQHIDKTFLSFEENNNF